MKPLIFLLLLLIVVNEAVAQKRGRALVDSLRSEIPNLKDDTNAVNLFATMAFWYQEISADSSILYGTQGYELAKQLNWTKGMGKSKRTIGLGYLEKADYPTAMEHLLEALKLHEQTNDEGLAVKVNNDLGQVYWRMLDFDKALDHFQRVNETGKKLNRKNVQAAAITNIGNVYSDKNDYKTALGYFQQSIQLYRAIGDSGGVMMVTGNMGKCYRKLGDLPNALKYQFAALHDNEKNGLMLNVATGYHNIGMTYFDAALDTGHMPLPDSMRNTQRSLQKANVYLLRAAEMYESMGHINFLSDALNVVAVIAEKNGDLAGALNYYRKSVVLRDSVYSMENRERIDALVKQREEDLQLKEIELQRVKLAKAEQQRWFLIGGFVLLTALAMTLFNRYRLQQRNKRALDMERVRSRISRDLHDDIGSTLSSINMLTHAAKKRLVEKELDKTTESLEKIQERTRRMLDNMSDIVWNIKPQNDALEEILLRMREYASTVLDAKRIDYTIDFPTKALNIHLPLDLKNNMYLVFKEAVNNLAKHANATNATLKLSIEQNTLRLEISDNGNGFNQTSNNNGNGLHNMKRRSEDVGATFNMKSNSLGTKITFAAAIPKTRDTRTLVNA